MVASILIIVFSVALFVYWFRYTCLLILSARTAKDYARQVAHANQLGFLEVQSQLAAPAGMRFDAIHEALSRDYRVLSNLLSHAGSQGEEGSLEHLMLRVDFHIMSALSRVAATAAPVHSRKALSEMADIVSHLANTMGERQAVGSAA